MKRTTGTFRLGAVAIAAVLLTACGGGKDDASDKVEDAAEKVEETLDTATDEASDAVDEMVDMAEEAADDVADSAGVSSSNAQALVDQCVSEGETEEICNCQIGAVEEALGEEDFSKLIELAANDDEEGAEALMTDIMSEKPDVAMQMGMKMMGCTGG